MLKRMIFMQPRKESECSRWPFPANIPQEFVIVDSKYRTTTANNNNNQNSKQQIGTKRDHRTLYQESSRTEKPLRNRHCPFLMEFIHNIPHATDILESKTCIKVNGSTNMGGIQSNLVKLELEEKEAPNLRNQKTLLEPVLLSVPTFTKCNSASPATALLENTTPSIVATQHKEYAGEFYLAIKKEPVTGACKGSLLTQMLVQETESKKNLFERKAELRRKKRQEIKDLQSEDVTFASPPFKKPSFNKPQHMMTCHSDSDIASYTKYLLESSSIANSINIW